MIYLEPRFASTDSVLRRGGHINRSDFADYQYVAEHFDDYERFYQNYGARLVQHPEGFFFLSAKAGALRVRLLPKSAMHLGMFIALKSRDPEITRTSARIPLEVLTAELDNSVPRETLLATYAPKQREASAPSRVLDEVQRCLRLLAELRFIDFDGSQIRPREAIRRFEDLARHENDPDELTRLSLEVRRGVVFDAPEPDDPGDADAGEDE